MTPRFAFVAISAALVLACAESSGATAPRATSSPKTASHAGITSVPRPAFLTYESGVLVGVNWVERTGNRVHSKSLLTQSMILETTVDLRPDETTAHSSSTVTNAGDSTGTPIEHEFADSAVYWSDFMPSSVEQAIRRARELDRARSLIPAASLFSSSHGTIVVDRVDATDWVVSYHNKRYEALTDSSGNLLAATLPDYGVTVERRAEFSPDRVPVWPPNEAPPDHAYRAAEVRIHAPEGHVLAGTLTRPPGSTAVPAAILITGLSPSDRNGGSPPWMPLRDIADALTRSGIAVLRVDDRGVEKSTGDRAPSTTFDEAKDVATEARWLRDQRGIDPKRIALVGYSEGGLIAPIVASRDRTIAAIVTLAGPGVPGLEVGRYQIAAAVEADSTIAPADREAEIEKQLAEPMTPRETTYLGIDPLAYAREVRCPALILQGGTDRHVPLRSAERMATAMRAGGNGDVTVRIFPGVSHSFLPDPVGLSSGWAMLPALHTSPDALRTLSEWLGARLRVAGKF